MTQNTILIFLISSFIFLTACTTTRLEEETNLPFEIFEGTSVVITSNSYHAGNETENDFLQCINKTLSNKQKIFNVVPTQQFINQLYPWFEPRTAPQSTKDLSSFLGREMVRAKIERLGHDQATSNFAGRNCTEGNRKD